MAAKMMRLLNGQEESSSESVGFSTVFGLDGGSSLVLYPEHIQYFSEIEKELKITDRVFSYDLIGRWNLMNALIATSMRPVNGVAQLIQDNYLNLSALVAFPLIEEVARLYAKLWDENGILQKEIDQSYALTEKDKSGLAKPKTYKVGHRIVLLSHKLYLMKRSFPNDFQEAIDRLDRSLQRPIVEGTENLPPIFERLEYQRNQWLHGRKFFGWEAAFISLFLALIYFRTQP